jgi:hypothetical protein
VAFSPDGQTILTGGTDNAARLWDAATGRSLGLPMRHGGLVQAVAFSPDGQTLLTGSDDTTARLWQAATGRPVGPVLRHEGMVRAAAFSPDGQIILTGSDEKTARLWDAATGRPLGVPMQHQGRLWGVAFSPDGQTIVTGSEENTARLWDAATGRLLAACWQHQSVVRAVAFSPDGKTVLTGSSDHTARLWPVNPSLEGTPEQIGLALSVLTGLELGTNGALRTLDPETWEERRRQLPDLPSAWWKPDRLLPPAGSWHNIQAAESEQQGHAFAASWHLNDLITRDPGNWLWHARRGRLRLLGGDLSQARADYARASACDPSSQLQDWYRHQLTDCRATRHWQAARWYADRLLARFPAEADLYAVRAEIAAGLGQPAEAQADVARAVELGATPALVSRVTRQAAVAQGAGAIRDWLILAPVPLRAGQTGAQGLHQVQDPREANLRPRAGDRVRTGGTDLVWQELHLGPDFAIDFTAVTPADQGVAYAVCYCIADTDRHGLSLLVGSDDEAKIYLNGKEIYQSRAIRGVTPDEDTVEGMALRAGTNVLVFKVVNEGGPWGGCVRFVERTGLPAKGIRTCLAPDGGLGLAPGN